MERYRPQVTQPEGQFKNEWSYSEYWPPQQDPEYYSYVDEYINDEGRIEGIDSYGRPKVDHIINGSNKDRHQDNLSRFTGYYHGVYFIEGIPQNGTGEPNH